MYALSDERRASFRLLSAAAIAGGMALLPLAVNPTSSSAQAASYAVSKGRAIPVLPGPIAYPAATVERDPFGDVPGPPANASVPADVARGAEDGVPVLRAVVVGANPQALVDFGGAVRVVGIGDAIGSAIVMRIDERGVELSSGTRLTIDRAEEKP